jgi:hypothetical protein
MPIVQRPLKTFGTRRYTDEVASGGTLTTVMKAPEVDGDLDTVIVALNALDAANLTVGTPVARMAANAVSTAKLAADSALHARVAVESAPGTIGTNGKVMVELTWTSRGGTAVILATCSGDITGEQNAELFTRLLLDGTAGHPFNGTELIEADMQTGLNDGTYSPVSSFLPCVFTPTIGERRVKFVAVPHGPMGGTVVMARAQLVVLELA